MSVSLARGCGAAAVLVLSAQSALADVSAQEVWAEWKSYLTGTGYEVSGTETLSGGTLTVSGVSMTALLPEDDISAVVTLPEIMLEENGDGTVNVTLPKEFPTTVTFDEDGQTGSVELVYSHDGSPILVSGDPDRMVFDYASALIKLALGEIDVPEEDIPADAVKLAVSLSDVVAKSDMQISGLRSYDQSMTASALTYEFAAQDPEGEGGATLLGALNGLRFTGSGTIPEASGSPDMAAMLNAGFAFDGTFAYDSGNTAVSGSEGKETFAFNSTSQGGTIAVLMDKSRLSYDVSQRDTVLNIAGSDIPFPVALSMAEAAFKLAMPVTQSEDEQDFSLGITLRDFAVPDMLWSVFDPKGVLPHDPATLVLDLAGKGKLLFDLFDPEAMESVEEGKQEPGELNALTVKQLMVSAAGAKLTGTGDFTFNNEDLKSFDGMPAPSGVANLQLTGANTLLDKLTEMGLMTENDAMGARMMMGMFAVPGEGDDTLNSEIEIKEDGSILANGQRLK
ncbi:DUF2125 domain-containing protein [Roseobacteraceae bacterium NS-SX3]